MLREMITFGYKNKFSGFIRALLAIAIGIVMVVSKTNALELAVQIIAAFLVATGVVTFFIGLSHHREVKRIYLALMHLLMFFLELFFSVSPMWL